MIQQIDHLSNFGIYRNFQGGGLPAFTKCNLIYGWNYSGKTTLSRLFQILERPERIASWPNSSFRVVLGDGSAVTHTSLATNPPPRTRVFNREFVAENFVQEHAAPAFILGAQNDALQQRLEQLNRRRERVARLEVGLQQQAGQAVGEIDQLGTDKARDGGNLLGDRNFRRPNLMQRVEEVRGDFDLHLLPDSVVTAKLEICRTTSAWTVLNAVPTTMPDLAALTASVAALMGQTASNRAIERLKSDRNLETWVRTGMALHLDKRECEYCGSPISEARLELLRGHFSQEYEALVRDLNAKIQECQSLRLDMPLPDERDFAPDLKAEFTGLRDQIRNGNDWAAQVQARMVEALTQKQTRIETAIDWGADLSRTAEGQTLLEQVNALIQRHNQAANELTQAKENARTALEKHFAALLFRDNDLAGKENRSAEARQRASDATGVLGRVALKSLPSNCRFASNPSARQSSMMFCVFSWRETTLRSHLSATSCSSSAGTAYQQQTSVTGRRPPSRSRISSSASKQTERCWRIPSSSLTTPFPAWTQTTSTPFTLSLRNALLLADRYLFPLITASCSTW